MDNRRLPVAALALSAAALIGLAAHEGYRGESYVPTQGDVPTIGFGSTVHADGSRVRLGEKTTPVEALKTLQAHLVQVEPPFRASLPGVEMTAGEYDVYLDFVYQYGLGAWQNSSMRRLLVAGKPLEACDALLKYRLQAGRDCSDPKNWGPRGCLGVWTRQQERRAACRAAVGENGDV